MSIKATLDLSKEKTIVQLSDKQGTITFYESGDKTLLTGEPSVYLLFKEHTLKAIGKLTNQPLKSRLTCDAMIQVVVPWDLEIDYLVQSLTQTAQEVGIKLTTTDVQIPASSYNTVAAYQENLLLILKKFGFNLAKEATPKKARPAKAQHRWRKEVSTIEFYVDDFGSKATIIWQKRNEMLLKKGATLRQDYELNKDGSVGLDVRVGTQLRTEQAEKIKDFTTTEDIILKSVNELGLFLYYGGCNSWLVLKDKDQKTIDEWTIVK